MSTSPQTPSTEAIRTLRVQLRADLMRFLELDAHFFGGYLVGWLATNLELGDLERVVDELDDAVRVDGHRLLDRPANRHYQ